MTKRIFLLGGSGNTGIKIAQLLLEYSKVDLTLGARRLAPLEETTRQLKGAGGNNRIAYRQVDAADKDSLVQELEGLDMVVVASATAQYVHTVAGAALEAGVDYLDIQYFTPKLAVLRSLEEEILRAGRCFITEAGFHPGLPAALVRYGGQYFDRLEEAFTASVIQQDWNAVEVRPSTAREFAAEMAAYDSRFYQDGEWQRASLVSMRDYKKVAFGTPYGVRLCAPMFLEELRALPAAYPDLSRTGFYIAGFHPLVDLVVFPVAIGMLKLFPRLALEPMARFMFWSMKTFSRKPYGIVLKLEARGLKEGVLRRFEIQLSHHDGYWFTAIPVVACLLQYLDGSIVKPGLWTMGNLVEPNRLLQDMERMGIGVSPPEESRRSRIAHRK